MGIAKWNGGGNNMGAAIAFDGITEFRVFRVCPSCKGAGCKNHKCDNGMEAYAFKTGAELRAYVDSLGV
jgi:hypothetical protein